MKLFSNLHISKIVCIFAGESNIMKNFDINKLSSCWQWQEKGNSWRGVGIYHVTASAMIRHPQKAAFGELKWQVVDGQIDGANVEWSPLRQSLWDCIQQIPVRHPQVQIGQPASCPTICIWCSMLPNRPTSLFARLSAGGCKVAASQQKLADFRRRSSLTARSSALCLVAANCKRWPNM